MKFIDMIRQEPVMFQALIQAALALLISFGLKLNSTQVGAVVAFSAAIVSFWTRTKVTPMANPVGSDGTRLLREAPAQAGMSDAATAGK